MSTTLLCNGYTHAGFISLGGEFTKVSLTSYSASFRKTIVQSQAMFKQASTANVFSRTKGPYFQDTPSLSCEITFEVELELLQQIFQMLTLSRNSIIKVKLTDAMSSIEWLFSECYLQSLSFNVNQDSILAVTLSLFVQPTSVSYGIGSRTTLATGTDNLIPITNPIPYYSWSLTQGNNGELKNITDFSFTFTQQIIPKYGCIGKVSSKAPIASKLVFCLPSMEFSYTQILHDSQNIDLTSDQEGTFHKLEADLELDVISIAVQGIQLFALTGLAIVEESPDFNGVPSIRKTYSVNGTIKA